MSAWGCSIEVIEEFVENMSEQTSLPASFQKTVETKLKMKQQFAAMQKAKLQSKKTRRRSRALSLLTPQK